MISDAYLSEFIGATTLGEQGAPPKVDRITHPNFKRTMQQAFFKVAPIAWVDLPATCFDRYGDRPVSEANIGTAKLSTPVVICEKKRDDVTAFNVKIDGSTILTDFATLEGAKRYVYDLYTSHINSIIIPVATAIAPADKADEVDYTDITND